MSHLHDFFWLHVTIFLRNCKLLYQCFQVNCRVVMNVFTKPENYSLEPYLPMNQKIGQEFSQVKAHSPHGLIVTEIPSP